MESAWKVCMQTPWAGDPVDMGPLFESQRLFLTGYASRMLLMVQTRKLRASTNVAQRVSSSHHKLRIIHAAKKVCYTTRCPWMWPVFWRLYFSIRLGTSSAPYLHDVSGTEIMLFYALVPMQRISSSMAVTFHIYLSPTDRDPRRLVSCDVLNTNLNRSSLG